MDEHTPLHFGGIPTDPQIRKLDEAFPDIKSLRGTTIPHEQIEKIIEEKRSTFRYKTVVGRWRRKVEARTGVVISGRNGAERVGFRVLLDGEQLDFGIGERKSARRKIRRWHQTIENIDSEKLSAEQAKIREHERLSFARIYLALTEAQQKPKTIAATQIPERPVPTV